MKKLKTPTAVTTAILTLITIFFWAGFEVYRSLTVKPTPTVPQAIINPINPTLDTNSLQLLQQRIFLDDSQIGNTQPIVVATPIATNLPTPTNSPIPTSSVSATPIGTASSSASPIPTP